MSSPILWGPTGAINLQSALSLTGSTSGSVTITTQPAAGTYNFNLPTTAGTSGYALTSGGGSSSPMTWTSVVTTSEVGVANGVASLDSSGKVPSSELPSTLLQYEGLWNPATNTPTLQDSTGVNAYVYQVSTAYAGPITGLNNATMVNFQVGNLVIFSSSIGQWEQTTPAAGVSSVNGAQGAVTLSVASSNGLAGTYSGTTLTLSTSVTGILYGNGTSIAAAIAGDFPTLNQNTTGTAANITATSNSTLTTLSALSLPGSQVTGDISGNAANITATSNSTLTTLSSLSLPTSQLSGNISLTTQVSGVLPIANGGTDNGSLGVTAGGVIYTDGTKLQNTGAGTSGQFLQSNGSSAPSWSSPAPSGAVVMYAGSSAPTGWLLCDGSSYSTTTYAALFAAIGYTFGGSGGSFNVPDTRGIFVRGAGTNGTLTNANGVAFSGTNGTYQNDKFQGHWHTVSDPAHTHTIQINGGPVYSGATSGSGANNVNNNSGANIGGLQWLNTSNFTGISVHSPATDGSNGTPRTGTETNPANLAMNHIIKT